MPRATETEKAYASQVGTKINLPNGDIESTAGHPNSKDHVIKVRIRNGKIMEGTVHYQPVSVVTMRQRKEAGEAKAKADKSKANRAAQLAKKRLRTPPPNNKQK